jgi:hypothetical protein
VRLLKKLAADCQQLVGLLALQWNTRLYTSMDEKIAAQRDASKAL